WNYLIKNPSVVSMRIVVKDEMLIRGSTADSAPMIPPLQRIRPVSTLKEKFFSDPHMKEIVMIEGCLRRCDALDMKIIDGIAGGKSYETLADELFVSPGTIHYRASAIYRAAGVAGRSSYEDLLSRYIDSSVKISDFF
ncbi:MAG: hypothetical protein PHG48_05455, partial [Eubacteriales bacterium]|nr:hypothetical protein [Eubacteriales bacterium]